MLSKSYVEWAERGTCRGSMRFAMFKTDINWEIEIRKVNEFPCNSLV